MNKATRRRIRAILFAIALTVTANYGISSALESGATGTVQTPRPSFSESGATGTVQTPRPSLQ